MTSSYDAAKATMAYANMRRNDPREVWGLPTGFPTLDKKTGGIHKGHLTILGAETGAGKSAMLGQIALSVARHLQEIGSDQVVRLVHCEMTLQDFNMRLACMLSDVPMKRIDTGKATDMEFHKFSEALTEIARLPIEYKESPKSIDDTLAFLREEGCAWWAVDHVQIHPVRGGLTPTSNDGISTLSREFARVARDVAPGMLLSQFTNESAKRENHRPIVGDLYGGKMLAADASNILLLYRPDIYQDLDESENDKLKFAELILAKGRNSGGTSIKMMFNPLRVMFREIEGKGSKNAAA